MPSAVERESSTGAEHDAAVEDVACEHRAHVGGRRVDISELDRGAEAGDRRADVLPGGVPRHVAAHVDGDLGLERRLGPAADRDRRAVLEQAAIGEEADERDVRAEVRAAPPAR